jgi:sterol-4alpha-carboxylate 3-dehydrogenase (decarboxylating)
MDGTDLKRADEESAPVATGRHLDAYSKTKALGEQICIDANGEWIQPRSSSGSSSSSTTTTTTPQQAKQLLTCVLRPHSMFGPRDAHFIAKLIAQARDGALTHLIGDGENMVDFTYVDNVAHAHILAAQALRPGARICGQAYFITNGEPRQLGNFLKTVLNGVGCLAPKSSMSFRLAYAIAYASELLYGLVGGRLAYFRPLITRHTVCSLACHSWFLHRKATRDFGTLTCDV